MKKEVKIHNKTYNSQLFNAFREKFLRQKIAYEHYLITNMNPKLEIKLSVIKKLPLLLDVPEKVIIDMIAAIDFLKLLHKQFHGIPQKIVKIEYPDSHKIVMVTGIYSSYINQFLAEFNKVFLHGKSSAKICGENSFWIAIEVTSEGTAFELKKYLRIQKRSFDEQLIIGYKMERRRVRIVILNEDFFTLLADAMSENKAEIFQQKLQNGLGKLKNEKQRKNAENSQNEKKRKGKEVNLISNENQIHYKLMIITNSFVSNSEAVKEEQYDDGVSECTSKNSEIDHNKIKELIETLDQGIQAENSELSMQSNDAIKLPDEMEQPVFLSKYKSLNDKELNKIERQLQEKPSLESSSVNTTENFTEIVSDLQLIKQQPNLQLKQQPESNLRNNDKIDDLEVHVHTQTIEPLYTVLKYSYMKKLCSQFQRKKADYHNYHAFIELPDFMIRESAEEKNRHLFYSSLCRKKIGRREQNEFN